MSHFSVSQVHAHVGAIRELPLQQIPLFGKRSQFWEGDRSLGENRRSLFEVKGDRSLKKKQGIER